MDRTKNAPLRLTAILAVFTLPLALSLGLAAAAQAETVTRKLGSNVTYTLNTDTGICVISGSGATEGHYYQSSFDGKESFIRTMRIESGITYIGYFTFYGCSSLKSVSLPSTVTSIGIGAFRDCTSLASVTIPSSVTSVGECAFYHCTSLKSFSVAAGNASYSTDGRALFGDKGKTLVAYANKSGGSYTIPSSVTSIGEDAFSGCSSLKAVLILGKSVKIDSGAFKEIALRSAIGVRSAVYGKYYGLDGIYSPLRTAMVDISGSHSAAKIKTSKVVAKGLKGGKLKASKGFKIAVSGVSAGVKRAFSRVSAPKKAKRFVKVSKAGKVTVKKGLGKGAYKVKVKVSLSVAGYTYKTIAKTIKVVVK